MCVCLCMCLGISNHFSINIQVKSNHRCNQLKAFMCNFLKAFVSIPSLYHSRVHFMGCKRNIHCCSNFKCSIAHRFLPQFCMHFLDFPFQLSSSRFFYSYLTINNRAPSSLFPSSFSCVFLLLLLLMLILPRSNAIA